MRERTARAKMRRCRTGDISCVICHAGGGGASCHAHKTCAYANIHAYRPAPVCHGKVVQKDACIGAQTVCMAGALGTWHSTVQPSAAAGLEQQGETKTPGDDASRSPVTHCVTKPTNPNLPRPPTRPINCNYLLLSCAEQHLAEVS